MITLERNVESSEVRAKQLQAELSEKKSEQDIMKRQLDEFKSTGDATSTLVVTLREEKESLNKQVIELKNDVEC